MRLAEIIWREEDPEVRHSNYVSKGGRWRILHPKRSASKQWELYDVDDARFYGDWPDLALAKNVARRRGGDRDG